MRKRPEVRLFDMWNSDRFEEIHNVSKQDYSIPETGEFAINVNLHSDLDPTKGIRKGYFTKSFSKSEDLFDAIDEFCCLGFEGVGTIEFVLKTSDGEIRKYTIDVPTRGALTNEWALEVLDAICKVQR